MTNPVVTPFWDEPTGSWQYVFHDPDTMQGAIVDPVLDFDPLSGATRTHNAQKILDHVRSAGIDVVWILDTHPHADHFSAAPWLAEQLGAPTAIGDQVVKVQALWKDIYHLPGDFPTDGSQWDRLFADGETFMLGIDHLCRGGRGLRARHADDARQRVEPRGFPWRIVGRPLCQHPAHPRLARRHAGFRGP